MGLFMQLKQARDADLPLVGHVARQRAALLDIIAMPFTLVLSSSLTQQLCVELEDCFSRLPEDRDEQIALFEEVTSRLAKIRGSQQVMESLRESFELVTLDTADLKSLAQLPTQKSILGLMPSPDYETVLGQRLFISSDSFEQFFEQLKSGIASFFTPQAIEQRRSLGIREWKLAFMTFRLPNIHNCFMVRRRGQHSEVQSYVGLPDLRGVVEKDMFVVDGDIPNIVDRTIREQTKVCVYAMDRNMVVDKVYHSASTSLQSAPDYDILEVARLAKKILAEWEVDEIDALFVRPKQGTMVLMDAYAKRVQESQEQESPIDRRLSVTEDVKQGIPPLEQAIRQDHHQGIREWVERLQAKLKELL